MLGAVTLSLEIVTLRYNVFISQSYSWLSTDFQMSLTWGWLCWRIVTWLQSTSHILDVWASCKGGAWAPGTESIIFSQFCQRLLSIHCEPGTERRAGHTQSKQLQSLPWRSLWSHQCCFECGPWTSSVCITWKFVRNAEAWVPPQTSWVKSCILTRSQVIHLHIISSSTVGNVTNK